MVDTTVINVPLPNEITLFDKLIAGIKFEIRVMSICSILAVDTQLRQVDVQPLTKLENGATRAPILAVPYITLLGGKSSISFPVAVGDMCICIHCDDCIDNAIKSTEPSIEGHNHSHEMNDVIAIVGFYPLSSPVEAVGNVTIIDPAAVTISSPSVNCDGSCHAASVHPANGWSGSFATGDERTVSVSDGIITGVG
jgi:hypothetical protein